MTWGLEWGQTPCPPRIQAMRTPLSIYNCPTRRTPKVYPCFTGIACPPVVNAGDGSQAAHSDYAVNGGDYFESPCTGVYYAPPPVWS